MRIARRVIAAGRHRGRRIKLVELTADDRGQGALEGAAEEARTRKPAPADLLLGNERAALSRAGLLLCLSDLLWIGQAALLAFCAASMLSAFMAEDTAVLPLLFLAASAFAFVLIGGARALCQHKAGQMARRVAATVKIRKRGEFLASIARVSPASGMPGSGQMAAYLSEQIDALGPYLTHFMPQQQRLKIVPLAIVLTVLPISWLASLILMVTGPVIPLFMALVGMRAKAASEAQQEELARMSGMLLDRLRGLVTLRLFGALSNTERDIETAGERFRNGTMNVLKIAFLSSTVLELFSALGIAFVAVYVGFSLLGDLSAGTWWGALSFGPGLFILLLAPEFFAPLRAYAAAYHDRAAGLAALSKLDALDRSLTEMAAVNRSDTAVRGTDPAAVQRPGLAQTAPVLRQAPLIDISRLQVGAQSARRLASVTFTARAGEAVILRGRSGSGKTTLIDCLLGFVDADGGHILINGFPLSDFDPAGWRRSVAWIGQSPALFHGSIRSNLELANETASGADLENALALAGASGFVSRLPKGLNTVIGEEGFGLSVGEGRRLALARAALRTDAPVLLADEPTAGLDDDTAQDVIAGLERLAEGRTVLLATHDPRVLRLSWRQIELTAGAREASA
ncbi:ATP-binding cassette subfamily C protein CydD [Roseibium hamelinense]|uniref:ATP-binding cassette subfamily C protein CydD n=1 Tax=Roseibium hamelinense TaxID=150831 RepID=A0A562T7M2_9HYPH|nr:ATP-binding cassette subfamily C protein CydD [Roseibium hamelinense]